MTRRSLPPPPSLGLDKYHRWREGQSDAVRAILECKRRFIGLSLPTGSGKSLAYIAAALLSGKRTVVLTGTKGLMTQIYTDFHKEAELVQVRGKSNYQCLEAGKGVGCDLGHCTYGVPCALQSEGCLYFDAVREARNAELVVTNYAFWLYQHRFGEGLKQVDLLVLDEAHDAPDHISSFLSFTLESAGLRAIGTSMPGSWRSYKQKDWGGWAVPWALTAERVLEEVKEGNARSNNPSTKESGRLFLVKRTHQALMQMAEFESSPQWVWEPGYKGRGLKFEPVWPGPYAFEHLFLDVPKVAMLSATLRPKTLRLLGLKPKDYEWYEEGEGFPVERRPVLYTPGAKMSFGIDEASWRRVVAKVDRIIEARPDVKGVIHTVSYARAEQLCASSRNATRFITHGRGGFERAVLAFISDTGNSILVSPVAMEGLDLKDDRCRFQIILKLPFPNTQTALSKARRKQDADHGMYVAAQLMTQSIGRGMRSEDDWCETFIMDKHWGNWAGEKLKRHMPRHVQAAIRDAPSLPKPLEF